MKNTPNHLHQKTVFGVAFLPPRAPLPIVPSSTQHHKHIINRQKTWKWNKMHDIVLSLALCFAFELLIAE